MQIQCSISIQIFSGAEVMYCIELNILFFFFIIIPTFKIQMIM